jgi:hypothetical protein
MERPPDEVLSMASARAAARAARDWSEADRLRAAIEAAGWKVVDRGTDFTLQPAHAPDVVEGGRVRHGSSATVPSRLSEPVSAVATVLVRVTDRASELQAVLHALREHPVEGTQLVVVADDPSPEAAFELEAEGSQAADPEVVWTSARLGHAASLNAGIRRAIGSVVVVLDPMVAPTGDVVSPLVRALEDPAVAVAGAFGLRSSDMRRFAPAPAGEVEALEDSLLAFRRIDAIERGPIDERFRRDRSAGTWWSLVLRDEGVGQPPRRAIALDLPVIGRPPPAPTDDPESARLAKRDYYRVLDRFGSRRDLLVGGQ